MQDGIYTNISNEEYNNIKALRATFVKTFAENPRTAWLELNGFMKDKICSPAMENGTLFHEAILEPEKYEARKVVAKRTDKETQILESSQRLINNMKMVFNWNKDFVNLIDSSIKEVTLISNGKKAKIDFLTFYDENTLLIGDLKTHSQDSNLKLAYAISDRNYILQMAYYKMLFEELIEKVKNKEIPECIKGLANVTKIKTMLVFASTNAPYTCCELRITEHVMDKGRARLNNILEDLKEQKELHDIAGTPWDDKNPSKFSDEDLMNVY